MLERITTAELSSVDSEIVDVIEKINRAPYARTRASCAGYGMAGESKTHHQKDETDQAYLLIEYDTADPRWERMHSELCNIARHVRSVEEFGAMYHLGYPDVERTRAQWQKVRAMLEAVLSS